MKFARQPFGFQGILHSSKRWLNKLSHKLGRRFKRQSQKLVQFEVKLHNFCIRLIKPFRGIANLLSKIFHNRKTQFFMGVIAGLLFWVSAFALFMLFSNKL